MKANELRIGNYVRGKSHEKKEWVGSHKISAHTLYSMEYPAAMDFVKPDIEPIPLTVEWLLKFGFIKIERVDGGYRLKDSKFYIIIRNGSKDVAARHKNETIANVNYVHEVQNLFYFLEKIELK